jgi:hypothetical protein
MRKKPETYLDTEAMKLGYSNMLADVNDQLAAGLYTDSIRTLMVDRKAHIEKRLKELEQGVPV